MYSRVCTPHPSRVGVRPTALEGDDTARFRPQGDRCVPSSVQTALTDAESSTIDALASPKSITVFGLRKSGLSIPAKPGLMLRFRTTTCWDWSTLRIGIP